MQECVDGEYQNYKARGGAYVRKEFFGKYPELLELVKDYSDEQIARLARGGHDPVKVYNAYKRAFEHTGSANGHPRQDRQRLRHGRGGRRPQHNAPAEEDEREGAAQSPRAVRDPDSGGDGHNQSASTVRPTMLPKSPTCKDRRKALGGPLPARKPKAPNLQAPVLESFEESLKGSGGRPVSTTMAFVAILKHLLKDKDLGKLIVPIIPDEGRTFGMESLFRQISIYAPFGQLYKPVDSEQFLYYKEAKDGQILEEGITEAGALAALPPREPRIRTTASRRFPSSFTTRCSDSSAWATSFGRTPTLAGADS